MKTYGVMEVQLHSFLTLVLDGGEWLASQPGRFTPKERTPGTHCKGGWMGPESRFGCDGEEKNSRHCPCQ
jgi:hypothetical protein